MTRTPNRTAFFLFAFFLMLFGGTACRTYVGSDDLSDTKTTISYSETLETGKDPRHGITVSARDNHYQLQFATKTYNVNRRYEDVWEQEGTEYYYYGELGFWEKFMYLLCFPVTMPMDCFYWSWEHEGENPPGILYQIAYLPFVRLLFQPILVSPASYLYDNYK